VRRSQAALGSLRRALYPAPPGPLYDIATQAGGSLSQLLGRDTERPTVFSTLLEELEQCPLPTVVVFEDVHWADEATLDLIKFLGRRIPHLPVLFLVTYRDTELSPDHPLWSVIGDLPGHAVARLRLAPLSEQAVTSLARLSYRCAEGLYAATLGNPFFVTEVLASDTGGVPPMVRDAVLARIASFSPAARPLLELASVVPTRTERWLLEVVLGSTEEALEACLSSGMLALDHTTVAFRHELARQAVESTLSPLRHQALHTRDDAAEEGTRVLEWYRLPAAAKIPALVVLGWVRVQRGDPGCRAVLDEARDLALATGELQRIVPVAAARAEAAWLGGNLEQCLAAAHVGYDLAVTHRYPWKLGELSAWMWRAGDLTQAPGQIAEPFARQIAGDWRGAAALWAQISCPYEQALALADGDAEAMRTALALFERLGAQPAVALVRRRFRQQGIAGIPRGPRPSTRTNQAGLTSRQREVLSLLAEGLSNAEIASTLFTSPKTVEHHASAVLAKLGVHARAQAIGTAHHLELLPNLGKPHA
jgi:DNA-binding CsgD family transcriptional regulator